MNIALALPNWIGDVVMATPMIRAVRRRFPDARLIGVMRPYVAQVLAGTTWLDETVFYDRKPKSPEHGFWPVVQRLRERKLDAILLLPNSLRFAALGWLSRAQLRIGYARAGRGCLLTHRLRAPRDGRQWRPVSAVDYYLELAYAVGCPNEERRLELATRPEDETGADLVWRNLRLTPNVVALNTGSANAPSRHWPSEYYVELARRLVTEDAATSVLVLCGPAERAGAADIAARVNHPRVHSMADQDLSLGVMKACIRRVQTLVTTDSGPRHIGHAFDVPMVCLFGPIDPRWTETYHARALALQHRVPCGPCGKTVCPLSHHACMRDLSVDAVYNAVRQQLQGEIRRVA